MAVFNHMKAFLNEFKPDSLQKTSSPNIICTRLKSHWRSNKSLPAPFRVIITTPVKDGTKVTVAVGNDDYSYGDIRNESAKVEKQVARFNDLRFVGKSGRGKEFHITITVHSDPIMVAIVPSAIKVTVDGPREPRAKTYELKRKASLDIAHHPPFVALAGSPLSAYYACMPTIPPSMLTNSTNHLRKTNTSSSNRIWRPYDVG